MSDARLVVLRTGLFDGRSAVMKVKDLYKSCLNTGAINAEGATPLMELINSTGEEV